MIYLYCADIMITILHKPLMMMTITAQLIQSCRVVIHGNMIRKVFSWFCWVFRWTFDVN